MLTRRLRTYRRPGRRIFRAKQTVQRQWQTIHRLATKSTEPKLGKHLEPFVLAATCVGSDEGPRGYSERDIRFLSWTSNSGHRRARRFDSDGCGWVRIRWGKGHGRVGVFGGHLVDRSRIIRTPKPKKATSPGVVGA